MKRSSLSPMFLLPIYDSPKAAFASVRLPRLDDFFPEAIKIAFHVSLPR